MQKTTRFQTKPELTGCVANHHNVLVTEPQVSETHFINIIQIADYELLIQHKEIACNKLKSPAHAIKIPRVIQQKVTPKDN